MRAAVYVPGNNELVLQDVPVPTPGPQQVLLKIAASGVCHSDTFVLSAAVPDPRSYTLGHENVGYAVQLGSEVKDITLGELYAIWDVVPCALAHPSTSLPPALNSIGLGKNGGFTEYIVVNQAELAPVPKGLSPEVACLAADSLITAYNAVHNVAQLAPGTTKRVLIFGIGGLGHQALQLAKSYGATVYACDIKPAARQLALSLGAAQAFDILELTAALNPTDPSATPLQVDVVIDFVVSQETFTLAKDAVKLDIVDTTGPGGLIVLVGLSTDQLPVSSVDLIEWRTNVLSTLYGTLDDMKAALDLLAKGVVKPVVATEPLDKVNDILNGLKAGTVTGRKVVIPA
ncbi:GroES-like protein [Lentinus tigrinus ALCF2SS1-7]|uniref:GroES-like protein n=1 Tax=Lentinus tigrinus ALCF2SS1-6 TaxID=1328759 RepID=A0A5C2SIG7_9APHY|nr:GroES-like protein [Lentinus tigrinus ALCF2SS1-6]RPD75280.1 GroES-like protein [Lentinus tigrinus ALCF2SS1-7]